MRFLFSFFSYNQQTFSLFLFSLLHFPVALPARSFLTVDDSHNYTTWSNFARFVDLEKGSHVTGVSHLKKYFHRFGYIQQSANFTDVFDSSLESAVLNYQYNLGLPVTSKLDSETMHLIMSPRCGVGDFHPRATERRHITKHFAYFYGHPRWLESPPVILTYAFSKTHMIDYISAEDIKAVFSRAFSRWAKVIPVSFTEVEDYRKADIKIGFYSGDHGDGEPFDGVLGVLAHAFSPESGRLHLDGDETWAVDFEKQKSKVAVDLESVATHEIGHVLGMAHSSVKESIMYPSLRTRSKKVDLRMDDVEGIQALYGSNPDFKFSSLLESEETSSNGGVGWWPWKVQVRVIVLVLVIDYLWLSSDLAKLIFFQGL